MNIILLSGGSGKRLWPLSNDVKSKQFLKIFKSPTGEYESMVQRMFASIREIDPAANIVVATSKSQVSELVNQIGSDIQISIEPTRRDTFAAIALATAYLRNVMEIDENEGVVVCPIDPYVDQNYFKAIKRLSQMVDQSKANLCLMGIQPTHPSEKYGYIIPEEEAEISRVKTFKEKPTQEVAESYIKQGALWNGGIFGYKLKYVLDIAQERFGTSDYDELFNKYPELEKISFDYAVVEKEPSIEVLRFKGKWEDLGTWNALSEVLEEKTLGYVKLAGVSRTTVLNTLDIPVLATGVSDLIIAASPAGILVASKEDAANIKPIVDKMDSSIRFAEKSWGEFVVLDEDQNGLTAKLAIAAGKHFSYHSHEHRDEIWTIISGEGKVIVDGMAQHVKPGDVITMARGCRHTIIAETDMKVIETQLGKSIFVEDKKKYEFEE